MRSFQIAQCYPFVDCKNSEKKWRSETEKPQTPFCRSKLKLNFKLLLFSAKMLIRTVAGISRRSLTFSAHNMGAAAQPKRNILLPWCVSNGDDSYRWR
jgi:hypothetical protein